MLHAESATSGGSFLPLLLIVVFIFGMYFLMIRPQQRRNRELQQMQASLVPGAEVMTGSGIYGTVDDVDEEEGTVGLVIADGVVVRIARAAVSRVISAPEVDEDEEEEDAVAEVDDEVDHETDTIDVKPVIKRKD